MSQESAHWSITYMQQRVISRVHWHKTMAEGAMCAATGLLADCRSSCRPRRSRCYLVPVQR